MKKKVLFTCVLFLFAGILCSCGKSKTEYTIDEFAEKWNPIVKKVNEETKYSTSADIDNEIFQLKEKYAKKEGLTPGSELTISGKISFITVLEDGTINFLLMSADDPMRNMIDCISDNKSLFFVDDNSNIKVKGMFLNNKNCTLSNCKIIAPQLETPDFKPNLDNNFTLTPKTYMGTVSWSQIIPPYSWLFLGEGYENISDVMSSYKSFCCIRNGDENSDYIFCCFPDEIKFEEGTRLAVRGVLKPVGNDTDSAGFIEVVYGYYVF